MAEDTVTSQKYITRDENKYSKGEGLTPLKQIDLRNCNSTSDILEALQHTAFAGRAAGEAADIIHEMAADPDRFTVLTLSGAMTMAQMGLVLDDMVEHGMADAIVSTGALITHGFVEGAGMAHFKCPHHYDDTKLYCLGQSRVYDTIELEQNLDDAELIVREVLRDIPDGTTLGSREVVGLLGKYLEHNVPGRGVLKTAYRKNVPIYIPAFTDSELGLDFSVYAERRRQEGKELLRFDPFRDLAHFRELLLAQKKVGIITIGGGVPRNWAQQIGPYCEILEKRAGIGGLFKYDRGVRICPEPTHWGGLSGCTYSEGVSWGKFVPEENGGRYAEVYADATLALPFIVKAVMERLRAGNQKSKRP